MAGEVDNAVHVLKADADLRAATPNSISVVVPTFNRANLIGRAILSVTNQCYPAAEIIVVDDCSSDDTRAAIAAYSGAIPINYIRLERNSGGGVARNTGVLNAKGRYIAFLDSDDEWEIGHLSALMNVAAGQSGSFVVASSALRINKRPLVLPGKEYPEKASIGEKLHFVLSCALAFQTSTLLMPKETAQTHMFDPLLRRHQDWDLIFTMIEQNVPLILLPKATVRYYAPDQSDTTSVGISRSIRPSLRFFLKHKGNMSAKTQARFIALQIHRRRGLGLGLIVNHFYALLVHGISLKEFIYYARESLVEWMKKI